MNSWTSTTGARRMALRSSYFLALSLLATACEQPVTCDEGSGQCSPADLLSVRLTHLDVKYDTSQPVYVNNRIPITFGLTAESPNSAKPVTRNVAVSFTLVEANPADPENPLGCGSSAVEVEVTGDGTENVVDAYVWPTTVCAALAGKTAKVNLQVDFEGGDEAAAEIDSNLDAPSVVLSEARRDDELNQLCRASLDGAGGERGCVFALDLQPTPTDADGTLIDVAYALSASSSVAVLPLQPDLESGPGGPADLEPALVVQSRFVVNGRDPYVSAVDPALIPASLVAAVPSIEDDLKFGLDAKGLAAASALPGKAVVSYSLWAKGESKTPMPLTIRDPAEPAFRVDQIAVNGIVPGTANDVAHELFLEGATRDAVSPGGIWANKSDFVVRGCFEAEFPQKGNEGYDQLDDCRQLEVVLVRQTSAASGASSRSFDKSFERNLGGDRIRIESSMSTQNHLDLSGASSKTEGEVALKGKIGKSFDLTLARAFGNANLDVDPTKTSYEIGVDAFNTRIYSVSEQAATIVRSEDFSASKSFTVGNLGFGFGPVSIGIKIGIGGSIGFEAEDTLEVLTDDATCKALLKADDAMTACGRLTRVATPKFGLTGTVEGGIDLKIVKAALVADLRFITTTFPLETTLGWGLTGDSRLLIRGDATWDMSIEPLGGDVAIVGKVGFKHFAKTLKVNLFSFSSPSFTTRLMSASMASFEELQ